VHSIAAVPLNPLLHRVAVRGLTAYCLGLLQLLAPAAARAGGPKYIAGTSYFNAGVTGEPVHWSQGQVSYYVDQGPLSSSVSNQQATAMVDAAAALWSAVPTAGVNLVDQGPLNEDVNGSNIVVNSSGQIVDPSDVNPSATNYPLAVIYDSDGSVTDALFGSTTSQPQACQNNGVYVWMDNLNTDATVAHGVILLNGLCATNANLLAMMSYQLERAFGRILGLDYSQVNPGALTDGEFNGALGWPVMQPFEGRLRRKRRPVHPQSHGLTLRRHCRTQPYLPDHNAEPIRIPRQANHCSQHHLHSRHGQLPKWLRDARCERRGTSARCKWESPLPVHRHRGYRRIF
jgi:hypothetical protein